MLRCRHVWLRPPVCARRRAGRLCGWRQIFHASPRLYQQFPGERPAGTEDEQVVERLGMVALRMGEATVSSTIFRIWARVRAPTPLCFPVMQLTKQARWS